MKTLVACLAIALGCAKAPAQTPAPSRPATETSSPEQQGKVLVPSGFGTLKQDEITVSMRTGPLLIKVTPLDEYVIRTAAPDTYNRLHALAESKRSDATARSGDTTPQLFLVSFFSYQPDVTFAPDDLQLVHQGRQMRATILPMTPNWGTQRMQQQEQQTAIYVFTDDVDYDLPLTVQYGQQARSEAWTQIISKLEVERARILARAK